LLPALSLSSDTLYLVEKFYSYAHSVPSCDGVAPSSGVRSQGGFAALVTRGLLWPPSRSVTATLPLERQTCIGLGLLRAANTEDPGSRGFFHGFRHIFSRQD